MEITSPHNSQLKEIRRALRTGKPTLEGLMVVEGPHLIAEARRSTASIEFIITTHAGQERYFNLLAEAGAEILLIPAKLFSQLASTETAQEVMALVRMPRWEWQHMISHPALILALDGLQDPGNAGTMVRSAEAFGATGVVFLPPSVRISNSKFLRATAGSIFRVPFLEEMGREALVQRTRESGVSVLALTAVGGRSLRETDLRDSCVLAIGNEGAGVSSPVLSAGLPVSIPTAGVESLNAAVACSLALYEARNQRSAN